MNYARVIIFLAKRAFYAKIHKMINMKEIEGISFITLMVIIAVLGLFLRIATEKLIKITISQNETNAQETLKLISTALENYANNNKGAYPLNIAALSSTSPPYLDKNYLTDSPIRGYSYSCLRLEPSGYSCSALPVKCKLTGKKGYTITTGGSLVFDDCEKKE